MPNSMLPRRHLLCASLGFGATYGLARKGVADTLLPTPAQTAGPFYPLTFPQDADNDLVHITGHAGTARGIPTRITGRILNFDGRPLSGAGVEIWQCDANGRYHYVRDGRSDHTSDENFQGYGTMDCTPFRPDTGTSLEGLGIILGACPSIRIVVLVQS